MLLRRWPQQEARCARRQHCAHRVSVFRRDGGAHPDGREAGDVARRRLGNVRSPAGDGARALLGRHVARARHDDGADAGGASGHAARSRAGEAAARATVGTPRAVPRGVPVALDNGVLRLEFGARQALFLLQ